MKADFTNGISHPRSNKKQSPKAVTDGEREWEDYTATIAGLPRGELAIIKIIVESIHRLKKAHGKIIKVNNFGVIHIQFEDFTWYGLRIDRNNNKATLDRVDSKAVTDGEIEEAAQEYLITEYPETGRKSDDYWWNKVNDETKNDFEAGAKWMREQHGEGAKERCDKGLKAAGEYLMKHMNDNFGIDYALFAAHIAKIASGYTDKQ